MKARAAYSPETWCEYLMRVGSEPDQAQRIVLEGGDLKDDSADELLIKCAMCGRSLASGIYVQRQSLKASDLSGKVHECPFCGFTTAYINTDYSYEGQ